MRQSDLYSNPAVEQTIYVHVKVISVEIEQTTSGPRVFIEMRVPPDQAQLSGRLLYAVIHPVRAAEYARHKFREAFSIEGDNFKGAEDMWAAVRVVPKKYDGTHFSTIEFVAQTIISRRKSRTLASQEAEGMLPPWDDEPANVFV